MAKLVLLASATCFWANPSLAQDAAGPDGIAAPQNTDNPGDIIVTARRTDERLQDVPISITVLSQQIVNDRNITNTADLGTYTPSLSTNSRFGSESASFAIRGFTQEPRTAPSVGVYFADVVAPRASAANPGGNGAGYGSMFDLQNIQVLRGPQGTLFGRNTTGGAILLVPNKPTDRFEGYVEGTLGNFNARRLQAVLNVPISDTLRVRAGMDWNKRDGYLNNRSGIGVPDYEDVNYIALRLSVVADLSDDLENYTIGTFSQSDTNGAALKAMACNRASASANAVRACEQIDRQNALGYGFWDVENNTPNPMQKTRQWQIINTTTWQASDNLTVKNIASYGQYKVNNTISVFGDNFFVNGQTLSAGGLFSPAPTGNVNDQATFTEELQFQGNFADGTLTWQAGAYLEVSKPLTFSSSYAQLNLVCTDVQKLQCANAPGSVGSVNNANLKDSFNSKGFYAQATYKLTDQLSLTGGIRYTIDVAREHVEYLSYKFPSANTPVMTCHNLLRFDSDPAPNVYAPLPVANQADCGLDFETKSSRPTWLIDLDYKPNDDLLLYVKWARGYRAGNINPINLGLETWKPEKVDTYEGGLKATFGGGLSGNFNIAGFYNDFRDQQLSAILIPQVSGLGGASVIINAGKSRMWGIEIDSSISPIEGLRFDLGYAYLNTKLENFAPPPTPSIYLPPIASAKVGDDLSYSPRNRVTLTGSYTLPLDKNIGRITVSATYAYTDAYFSLARGSTPLAQNNPTNLVNLNVNWKSVLGSPADLSFFMTNVTNDKNWVASAGGYAFLGLDTAVLAPPRMFGFRLRYNLGQ